MKLIVKKSQLKGTVAIPGSKSHTIRAVAIASLANGKSIIRNPLISNDTLSSVDCYRLLGAEIDTSKENSLASRRKWRQTFLPRTKLLMLEIPVQPCGLQAARPLWLLPVRL